MNNEQLAPQIAERGGSWETSDTTSTSPRCQIGNNIALRPNGLPDSSQTFHLKSGRRRYGQFKLRWTLLTSRLNRVIHLWVDEMRWLSRRLIGNIADARLMNLIVDYHRTLTILYIMYDFSNTDTFLRSALYSATTCYKLGQLRQLLTSQEDAEGGAIIFIFKETGAYRESANLPRHAEMTLRKIWHRGIQE